MRKGGDGRRREREEKNFRQEREEIRVKKKGRESKEEEGRKEWKKNLDYY